MMIRYVLIMLFISGAVFAQSQENPAYPIVKFKKETLKLWEYPEAKNSIKIKSSELGKPSDVAVYGLAGRSKGHLILSHNGQQYTLSRGKVVLDPEFDKRTATGLSCSQSNLGKNEQRAETTSVCER